MKVKAGIGKHGAVAHGAALYVCERRADLCLQSRVCSHSMREPRPIGYLSVGYTRRS